MKRFIVLACVLMLSACARSEFSKFESDFFDGCERSGATEYVCKCTFEKLVNHYGEDKIGHFNETQNAPPEFLEFTYKAGIECRQ